jgi:hypothetical protein
MRGIRRFGFIAAALAAAMMLAMGCGKENGLTGYSSKGLIKGNVTIGDAAVAGAAVFVDGVDTGVVTDEDGSFELDLPAGDHIVSLVVDGVTTSSVLILVGDDDMTIAFTVTSGPDGGLLLEATVVPTPDVEGCAAASLDELRAAVEALDDEVFSGTNGKRTFLKKIDVVIKNSEKGNCQGALAKLTNDVAAKADGCTASGAPDANDWIVDCAAQEAWCRPLSTSGPLRWRRHLRPRDPKRTDRPSRSALPLAGPAAEDGRARFFLAIRGTSPAGRSNVTWVTEAAFAIPFTSDQLLIQDVM